MRMITRMSLGAALIMKKGTMMTDPAPTTSKARHATAPTLLAVLVIAAQLVLAPAPAWAASFLERAQEYFAEGDLPSATVELKNALQRDPDNAEARFLLGRVHLQAGDLPGAEKELLRARELGYQGDDFELTFSALRLRQGRYQEVVSDLAADIEIDTDIKKDLFAARAEALLGLGQIDEATAIYDRILGAGPHARALLGKARIAMALGDPETARDYLDRSAELGPDEPDLVFTDAIWLYQQRRFEESETRFARAVSLEPTRLQAHLGQIQSNMVLGELEVAEELVRRLARRLPGNLLVVLQDAIVQFLRGEHRAAKSAADRVLAADDNQRQALLVAGYSAFQLGDYEQARSRLSGYLADHPTDKRARMVLGATFLRLDQAERAYEIVGSSEIEVPDSAAYLGVLTGAAFGAGDRAAGLRYLQRLAAKSPNNAEIQEKLGVARMQSGDDEGAAQALKISIALAPGRLNPYTRLFAVQVRQQDLAKALETAQNIKTQFPENSAGNTFLGITHAALNDNEQARAAFQSAVDQDPGNIEAATNLAAILRLEGENAAARAVFDGVLQSEPGHLRTLLAYADLERQAGNQAEAEKIWRQAMAANAQAPQPRVLLARSILKTGRIGEALALAEQGLAEHPEDSGLLETVGLARLRVGDNLGALEAFEALAIRRPENAQVQTYRMVALERNGKGTEALAAADAVLELDPTSSRARVARIRYLAQLGRLAEAKDALATLKQEGGNQAELLLIEGRIALVERRFDDAAAALDRAHELQPSNTITIELARALHAADRKTDGFALLRNWLHDHPKDLRVHTFLVESLVALDRLPEARDQYRIIINLAPDNVRALSNLAALEVQLGAADKAVPLARKGLELSPGNGPAAYALARALLETGALEEALGLLEALRKASETHTGVRYHYARALAVNGQPKKAISELQALLADKAHESHRVRAEALLETLPQ